MGGGDRRRRMEDQELEILLKDIESDRTERKASASDGDKIRQAICAFANDMPNHRAPGVVFVGVHDNGTFASLPITDRLLRTLADMRSDGNILPIPTLKVQKRRLLGEECAVIVVEPSDAPPVRYKGQVWIRVGPRRAIATVEEERRLTERRRAKDLTFDLKAIETASLSDLDRDLFSDVYLPSALPLEVIEENRRTVEEQMQSLRFLSAGPDPKPTTIGVLAVGLDPRSILPGAYIQFVRFDGSEVTDPIKDQKEIEGPLSNLLDRLDEVFLAHISVATDVTSATRESRRPDFPIVALQQLSRNAILHRNYEGTNTPVRIHWFTNHLEILSPGGPFGQVTRENFGRPGVTDYRNPHLAEAMKNLGYVQRFGIGIELARKELEKNGNPPPEFDPQDSYVLVTLRAPK